MHEDHFDPDSSLRSPSCSPDGEHVAVYWDRGGGIWLFSVDGSDQRRILEGTYHPIRWSADGRWVYAFDISTSVLVRVRPADGTLETLDASGRFVVFDVSPDGEHVLVVEEEAFNSDLWLVEVAR